MTKIEKNQELPWIGTDLDGTLAYHGTPYDERTIGPPIEPMVRRVKSWLQQGRRVKIMTARANSTDPAVYRAIKLWCRLHIGQELEITSRKDYMMVELYDDRAVEVEHNVGRLVGHDDGFNPPTAPNERKP